MVLYGPGIFATPWACEHVDGMIQAFMPGPAAGKVIADVLDGTANPGGKMTMTVPRSVGQVPVTYNHRTGSGYASSSAQAETVFSGGYVDESNEPLFCFGHGLSYTTFALSDFHIADTSVPTDGKIVVSCKVKNTGSREGDEVVQLYYHTKKAHVIRPVKQLAGFKRISLAAGEEKTVTFTLDTAQLGYYNEDMEFVVEPTRMDVMIGTSAHDIAFCEEVTLTGEKVNVMGKRVYTCRADIQSEPPA